MKRRGALLAVSGCALAAGVGIFWYVSRHNASVVDAPRATTPVAIDPTQSQPTRPDGVGRREFRESGLVPLAAVTPAPLSAGETRSPLADTLNAPERTGADDLAALLTIFERYHERFGALPTGETNAQFVNALTGNNPRRVALIERSHPAINAKGELTDRWGTAVFFHLVSHDALEIRSAGPDKEMWTPDDLVTQSPSLRQPPRRER